MYYIFKNLIYTKKIILDLFNAYGTSCIRIFLRILFNTNFVFNNCCKRCRESRRFCMHLQRPDRWHRAVTATPKEL